MMKNLTTPQAILIGLGMIAFAIASVPFSSKIVTSANASNDKILKIAICSEYGTSCADISKRGLRIKEY